MSTLAPQPAAAAGQEDYHPLFSKVVGGSSGMGWSNNQCEAFAKLVNTLTRDDFTSDQEWDAVQKSITLIQGVSAVRSGRRIAFSFFQRVCS